MNNDDLITLLRAQTAEWEGCVQYALHRMRLVSRDHCKIDEAIRYTEDVIAKRVNRLKVLEGKMKESQEKMKESQEKLEEKLPPGVSKVNGYYVMTPTDDILEHANSRINEWRSIAHIALSDMNYILDGGYDLKKVIEVTQRKILLGREDDDQYRAHQSRVRMASLQKFVHQKRHPQN